MHRATAARSSSPCWTRTVTCRSWVGSGPQPGRAAGAARAGSAAHRGAHRERADFDSGSPGAADGGPVGGGCQRSFFVEQTVDSPVQGGGGWRGGLQGVSPRQSSTGRSPGGPLGLPSGQGCAAFDGVPGQGFLPGQSSTAPGGADHLGVALEPSSTTFGEVSREVLLECR